MGLQDAKSEAITYLFEKYESNPGGLYDIADIPRKHKIDPHEFGKYLVEHGLVKNQQYRPNAFVCQITFDGIDEADPNYFQDKMNEVIFALGESGTRMSVTEILGYEPKDHQKVFDIVKYLETTGMIKTPQYLLNNIVTELSLEGREYYEKNKPEWGK